MSLFQSREWWTYRLDADEEYDIGGLVIGNIDNDPSQSCTWPPCAAFLRQHCPLHGRCTAAWNLPRFWAWV